MSMPNMSGSFCTAVRAEAKRTANALFELPRAALLSTGDNQVREVIACALWRHYKKHIIVVQQNGTREFALEPATNTLARQLQAVSREQGAQQRDIG